MRRLRDVTSGRGIYSKTRHASSKEHRDALAHRAPVQCPPTADTVKCEDADEGREHVEDIIKPRNPLRLFGIKACNAENSRRIYPSVSKPETELKYRLTNRYPSNPNPLLHHLQPNHQLHPPSRMQIPRPLPRQHRPIRRPIPRLLLQIRHIPNILKLRLGLHLILTLITPQSREDKPCFLFPSDFHEPPWRFREPPDGGEEEEERDDLEGDGETPADGRRAGVDE